MRRRFRDIVDCYQHRDLRVVHRSHADKRRCVTRLHVALFLQDLGRRSLAADTVAGNISVFTCAACNDLLHRLTHISRGLLRDDLTDDRSLGSRLDRTVRIQHLLDNVGLLELAVVHNRADHVQLLQRGNSKALAKRCGRQRDLVPFTRNIRVMELAVFLIRQVNPGLLKHAERFGVFIEAVFAYLFCNLHHCHVAGIH